MAESTPAQHVVPHEGIIQVEDDSGSDYYSDGASDLTSLSSSVQSYVYENGRRYHSYREGKYVLPNDEKEMERLDFVHHLFMLTLHGDLYKSPLKNPQTVMDLGTGTGIWAIDMADLHASASVVGNDLSPIQPKFVPPNCEFIVEDFEEDWSYPDNHFDFIHGRTLSGAVKDWKELMATTYRHAKPGGWVEFHEGTIWAESDDGSLKEDSRILTYLKLIREQSENAGRSMNVVDNLGSWMSSVGFENVKVEIYKVPWGPWPKDARLKEIGKFQLCNMMEAVSSYGLALLTRGAGYSQEEAEIFLALVRREITNKSLHCYNKIYCVYGQKPASSG
ncbi:UMTA methyltransferase family protein [Paecilomyces variotii No. 5]|uniref:UMTA methyltransferase family protein n=1 Tax=Byssochlamys spectabilis (strain No. 5 / NBRC 109023) TaxID=1356009 RepID=V5FH19_BYSSN|nr:UMTA methyltransferase family protein [Paecilomyces variotii No. 5]